MGLVDKIKLATSAIEVETLVNDGKINFVEASQKTKRRWTYVAVKRQKELALAKEKTVVATKKTEKSKK